MQQRRLTIPNKLGLHARAAMKLSDLAIRYQCEIIIIHNERRLNAKDIMAVLALGASQGTLLEFNFHGEDEAEALLAIERLFENRFGESD